jgi:hypothetical protein
MVNIIMEGAVQYLTQGPSVGLREWQKNKKKAFWPGDGWQCTSIQCVCVRSFMGGGGGHTNSRGCCRAWPLQSVMKRRRRRHDALPAPNDFCLVVICGNLFLLALSLSVFFLRFFFSFCVLGARCCLNRPNRLVISFRSLAPVYRRRSYVGRERERERERTPGVDGTCVAMVQWQRGTRERKWGGLARP